MSDTSLIVRRMLNSRFTFRSQQIIYSIGRLISDLTDQEVDDLYTETVYKDYRPSSK